VGSFGLRWLSGAGIWFPGLLRANLPISPPRICVSQLTQSRGDGQGLLGPLWQRRRHMQHLISQPNVRGACDRILLVLRLTPVALAQPRSGLGRLTLLRLEFRLQAARGIWRRLTA